MKFFSYRLSTLLLVYVTVGAVLGVCLTGDVWQLAATLELEKTDKPISLFEFDGTSDHLAAFNGEQLYLFDMKTKQRIWKHAFLNNPGTKVEMRFVRGGEAVEMVLIDSRPEVSLQRASSGEVALLPTDIPFYYTSAEGQQRGFVTVEPREKSRPHYFKKDFFEHTDALLREEAIVTEPKKLKVEYNTGPDTPWEKNVIKMERDISAVRYSPDGQYLAAGHAGSVTIWRRTRNYGGWGIVATPLYWIMAALVIVIVIKVHRLKPIE